MKLPRRRFLHLAAGAAALPVLLRDARAEAYPTHLVRWMIGFPPGGAVDIVARIMGHWLSEHFGQQFLVENRAGSGGNIATAAAINSPPDGYTLLFVGANNAISASLYKKLPFDFIRDTVPVAGIMHRQRLAARLHIADVATDQNRSGLHRLLQGKSRKSFICLTRQRYVATHVSGIFQGAYPR